MFVVVVFVVFLPAKECERSTVASLMCVKKKMLLTCGHDINPTVGFVHRSSWESHKCHALMEALWRAGSPCQKRRWIERHWCSGCFVALNPFYIVLSVQIH